ncbi:HAD family hydrolase [Zobellella endophytica]|uniref:HAD family hydrolase n=1 Tax=Zobellella endophytica TaxID=2116700 RepID=A0A2P7R4L6_9GAMM|nr:HAD-IA family hydrolase [Zobellella endophytica]PSJ45138.1 HAD family hydrolase [Zobellella endophytica]
MRFYKRLGPVKVLSFDLDDTLYDNVPVMAAAETWLLDALKQDHPESTLLGKESLAAVKRQLLQERPELAHDVSACRRAVLTEGLRRQGVAEARAAMLAEEYYLGFLAERGRIQVPEVTHRVLSTLGLRHRLAVITNGNLPLERTELAPYFETVLRAGPDGRMKPAPDMFLALAERLGVAPSEILHVGDHINTDVAGAVRSGCQAVWLNDNGRSEADLHCLPQVTLERLEQLLELL